MSTATISPLKRTLKLGSRTLPDIPGKSEDELKKIYARLYPEITTAVLSRETTATGITLTWSKAHGTKG